MIGRLPGTPPLRQFQRGNISHPWLSHSRPISPEILHTRTPPFNPLEFYPQILRIAIHHEHLPQMIRRSRPIIRTFLPEHVGDIIRRIRDSSLLVNDNFVLPRPGLPHQPNRNGQVTSGFHSYNFWLRLHKCLAELHGLWSEAISIDVVACAYIHLSQQPYVFWCHIFKEGDRTLGKPRDVEREGVLTIEDSGYFVVYSMTCE